MKDVVILPTYNEKDNIARIVEKIFEIVPDVSIFVVDDNSPDGTAEIVREMQKKFSNLSLLVRAGKEGLGRAYTHAIKKVLEDETVRSIVLMDADYSHNPSYLPQMFALSKEYDVVIGSRYIKGGGTEGWGLRRKLLSRFGNAYTRLITRLPIRDCSGGFYAIRTSAMKDFDFKNIRASGYAFLVELKYNLYKNGASIKEFPIIFKNRVHGKSKLSASIMKEALKVPWKLVFKKNKLV